MQLFQKQIIELTNSTLVNQLKDIYKTASNQYQVLSFTGDKETSIKTLSQTAKDTFASLPSSIGLGVSPDGSLLFCAVADGSSIFDTFGQDDFCDTQALDLLNENLGNKIEDGSLSFDTQKGEYFGVYKYSADWNCYFIRAELRRDTKKESYMAFLQVAIIILVLTLCFLGLGVLMFKKIFSNVRHITQSMYEMQQQQSLSQIDLSKSGNDDITYLAASFNSLSSTIDNLLNIFKKFASKDVVDKAYEEHAIHVDGDDKDLVMLFSDIKSFTFRTETLGNEIKYLLKVHYNNVIHLVHQNAGVVGSIIGDAILAIFGTLAVQSTNKKTKELCAVETAWDITHITADLRAKLQQRRKEIEKTRTLSKEENADFDAILIDVGVGVDGGTVFYGTIGSGEHMTNTVIGDRVNSASRLEGLTRIYHLPVIVSTQIKQGCTRVTDRYVFYEIDTVQVKGKTQGKKIYFPFDTQQPSGFKQEDFSVFSSALSFYYKGDWQKATQLFMECKLEVAGEFLSRINGKNAPDNWSGIWTMTTK